MGQSWLKRIAADSLSSEPCCWRDRTRPRSPRRPGARRRHLGDRRRSARQAADRERARAAHRHRRAGQRGGHHQGQRPRPPGLPRRHLDHGRTQRAAHASTSSSTIPTPRRASWRSPPPRACSAWSAARSARPTPSPSPRRRAPSASAAASPSSPSANTQTVSTFVFGNSLTVNGGGATQTITRPGSQVVTNFGGTPGNPTPVPPGGLTGSLGALEGNPGTVAAAGGGNAGPAGAEFRLLRHRTRARAADQTSADHRYDLEYDARTRRPTPSATPTRRATRRPPTTTTKTTTTTRSTRRRPRRHRHLRPLPAGQALHAGDLQSQDPEPPAATATTTRRSTLEQRLRTTRRHDDDRTTTTQTKGGAITSQTTSTTETIDSPHTAPTLATR